MNKFAVFDVDGTLIRWQLYHAVVDKLAKQGMLEGDSHQKIHDSRMRWKNRGLEYGFSQYEAELIKQFENSLKKLDPEVFESVVEQVIEEYKDQTYYYTRMLLKKLKSEGYTLLAISGSQQELVEMIAQYYGFDDCIGTNYQTKNNKFTGEVTVASHDKKRLLSQFIKKYDLTLQGSFAIGDSKSDAPMLEMVQNPIAFNPDNYLYEIAKEKHWPIIIERKNMIYRLEYKDGSYILAKAN